MGTRKKKDRRSQKRQDAQTRPLSDLNGDVSRSEYPRITSLSPNDFDEWLQRTASAAEARERRFREFTETPLGWVLLNANGNRRPAHLLTPDELFTTMPTDPHDRNDYTGIIHAWSADREHHDPASFVSCECPVMGLGELWNGYAGLEQFYMDVWSLLNAEVSRDEMLTNPPKDVARMRQVLHAAQAAFEAAYEEQASDDSRYLYAYDVIRIAEDSRVERLLEAATENDDSVEFGESDFRGSTLWFTAGSGPDDHTATAAGYRAAVEVLRQNGIGCEQWSSWD